MRDAAVQHERDGDGDVEEREAVEEEDAGLCGPVAHVKWRAVSFKGLSKDLPYAWSKRQMKEELRTQAPNGQRLVER